MRDLWPEALHHSGSEEWWRSGKELEEKHLLIGHLQPCGGFRRGATWLPLCTQGPASPDRTSSLSRGGTFSCSCCLGSRLSCPEQPGNLISPEGLLGTDPPLSDEALETSGPRLWLSAKVEVIPPASLRSGGAWQRWHVVQRGCSPVPSPDHLCVCSASTHQCPWPFSPFSPQWPQLNAPRSGPLLRGALKLHVPGQAPAEAAGTEVGAAVQTVPGNARVHSTIREKRIRPLWDSLNIAWWTQRRSLASYKPSPWNVH